MRVLLAAHMGLCSGVRRALQMTEKSLAEGKQLFSLGDLIHNPQEMERLAAQGLHAIEQLADAPAGSTLLLRTHGSAPSVLQDAKSHGLKVVDSTCPHVRAAEKAAQMLAKSGYRVVIVGDPDHPEVQAVLEWAGEGSAVIRNVSEAMELTGDRFGVLSQTTEQRSTVDAVCLALRQKGEVKLVNTICTATYDRQEAIASLADRVNTMIVVGGKNSANTAQLARIAGEHGSKTYLVERASEIEASWLAGLTEIGVSAGASTPDWIIKEVVDLLEEMNKPEPVITEAKPSEPEAGDVQAQAQDAVDQVSVGDIVETRVVKVESDGVMVDAGYKSAGYIDRRELARKPDVIPGDILNVGDVIKAMVLQLESGEGNMKLSKRRADEVLAWQRLQQVHDAGETIEAPVVEQVKGGLTVDVGLRGFVPASQVERSFGSDLSKYVGQTVKLKVIEIDKAKNRVILSRRAVVEEEAEKAKKDAWGRINEGDVITGTVKSMTEFGAFVDLGGVDGLLHVSELSWGRVKNPADVLSIGQEITVKVLKLDTEKGRISLGYKHMLPDPWETAAAKYSEGMSVKGKVTRVAPFGAFVELEEGIEGLVHISELANRRVQKVEDVVTPGQEVTARVLAAKPEERRISLSMKEPETINLAPKRERSEKPKREREREREVEQNDKLTIGDVFGDKLRAFADKKVRE